MDIKGLITSLDLQPHPEGGYFRETYRSEGTFNDRNFSTGIYYLLGRDDFSSFHRIASDEMWHFYSGAPLRLIELYPDKVKTTRLGPDLSLGHCFQYTVSAGVWFGAISEGEFSLVGCTVAPGFDFQDFTMARKSELMSRYSFAQEVLEEFCLD